MSTILVVDDEEELLTLVETILKGAGYRVLTALNGPEALSVLEREEVDLVLLDVMMPGMDGWEVAAEIRKNPRTRDVPVAMLTVKAMSPQYFYSKDAEGIMDYINKPFSKKELLDRVKGVLDTVATINAMRERLADAAAPDLIKEYEDLLRAEQLYKNLNMSLRLSLERSEKGSEDHKLLKEAVEYGKVLLKEVKKKKDTYERFIKDLK
ncbi:MAG: response regulator [Methanobacteriota archaeon]|nr:MAG: response regulator [Euryarchaeota archaeon]